MTTQDETLDIPTKLDNYSAVTARDFPVYDVPFKHERPFDYDDYEGIIDDLDNPYDRTKPILVYLPEENKPDMVIEVLGGKCTSCEIDNPLVLRIDSLDSTSKPRNPNKIIRRMIQQGQDPTKKFQILCHNYNILKSKINKERRRLGLPILSKISPVQGILN